MSEIYKRLRLAEQKRKKTVTLNLGHQHIKEISEGSTKDDWDRMKEDLFEELLTRGRPIRLKVTCPHCKQNISMRFRLKLKSRQRNATGRKVRGHLDSSQGIT